MQTVNIAGIDYITAPTAGNELGITRQRVYQLIKSGRLNALKIGRSVFVNLNDVREFSESDRTSGRPRKNML